MPELVERTAALESLDQALRAAADGHGSVVLVTGEPGVGKSALVTCFAGRHRHHARVLVGLCDDLATPRPLGPFRDLADQLPGALGRSLLDDLPPGSFSTSLVRELRVGPAPTLVVLEDVHWADQATLDVVTVLGRRVAGLPVLLVLTARSGEADPGHPLWPAIDALQRTGVRTIEPAPLSLQAVRAMAGPEAERIYALTGGNPFFVAELLAAPDGPPPPSLANAVLARVARLDDRSRRLLELVSMAPGRMSTRVLDQLDPDWPAGAEQAERRRLLTSDPDHVRFRHELTRSAVRSSVPPGRRRQLHGRILHVLRRTGADPAELVHHAEAAGAPDVVAEHALAAARQARALESHREALAHFRRAVRHLDRLPLGDQAHLWEELAATAHLVGSGDEATDAAGRAIALHQQGADDHAAGRCIRLRSQLHWFTGNGRVAWQDACAAVSTLSAGGPSAELARAYAACSELAMLANRAEDALRWGAQALALGHGDDAVLVRALAAVGATRMQLDPQDTGLLQRAVDTARSAGAHQEVALVHAARAFVGFQWVRPDEAEAAVRRGAEYARDHEVDTMARYLEALLGWLSLRRGRCEDADRAATGRARATGRGGTVVDLVVRTVVAERAVRQGADHADALLAEVAAEADRTGEVKRIGPVFELQVERALTCGDPLPAERLDEISATVGEQSLRRGAAAARIAAWGTVCGTSRRIEGPAPPPHAAMLRGDWRSAAEAFGAVGWQHDKALLLSLTDDGEALAEALAIARASGAAPLERRIAGRLRAAGLPVPRGPVGSTRANPAGLTDRQVEVLTLLNAGHGNADIARRLHISPRTVEHHVAGILTKLGVSSRWAAAAKGSDLGVV